MMQWIRHAVIAAFALIAHAGVQACPLCLASFQFSITGQDLADAQNAVLATPAADGRQYRVVAVVKGGLRVDQIVPGSVFRANPNAAAGKPMLFLRQDKWASWVSFGAIDADHADWLRRVAAMKAPDADDAKGWRAHVAHFLPYLASSDAMVAEVAASEVARAPYAAMRAQKGALDVTAIRRAADDAPASQRAIYTLLWGVVGNDTDATSIEQRLAAKRTVRDAANLGPLLAANLELRGPSRVAWVEKTYLRDPARAQAEVEAALLGLAVHGDADLAIPRAQIVATYHRFIREHKAIAGLVAAELAEWEDWSAVPVFLALLKDNTISDPASRYAAMIYVQRSPRLADHAALKAIAARGN